MDSMNGKGLLNQLFSVNLIDGNGSLQSKWFQSNMLTPDYHILDFIILDSILLNLFDEFDWLIHMFFTLIRL